MDWDRCEWLKSRLARDPKAVGRTYCDNMRANYVNKVLPALGKLYLEDIDADEIDRFATSQLEESSTQSVKHILNSLKPVLANAKRKGLIRFNPMLESMPVTVRKEPFSIAEANALLDLSKVESVWGIDEPKFHSRYKPWNYWLLNAIGACTGRRLGEVLVLRVEDFDAVENTIWVRRSAEGTQRIKEGTKTGEGNKIPIDPLHMKLFLSHLPLNGWVFPGKNPAKPRAARTVFPVMSRAFTAIGIAEAEQKRRHLGFHSWRHFFVTRSRAAGVSDAIISSVTEHDTARSMDRYTRLSIEDKRVIAGVQQGILRLSPQSDNA